jgi:hypothetical protein
MIKRLFTVLALVLAFAFICNTAAMADTVIDFESGGVAGGVITLYADGNLSGVDVKIGDVKIWGAPINTVEGESILIYDVVGGLLNFNTGGMAGDRAITITGAIPDLEVGEGILLSGTVAGFDKTKVSEGLVAAFGLDYKSRELLDAIGIDPLTPFNFFGFSLVVDKPLTVGKPGIAISTDIRNTAVPEPSTLILLGCGLAGLGLVGLKRK